MLALTHCAEQNSTPGALPYIGNIHLTLKKSRMSKRNNHKFSGEAHLYLKKVCSVTVPVENAF